MIRGYAWILAGTLALFGAGARQPPAQPVEEITVQQAALRIQQAAGHRAVIVFYKTNCPLSQAAFPSLVALARQQASSDVVFLVFSIGDEDRMADVPAFLARYQAPFRPVFVHPWAPGTLSKAMAPLGIAVGQVFTTPLVAVRNSAGITVAQAQGLTSVAGLERILAATR